MKKTAFGAVALFVFLTGLAHSQEYYFGLTEDYDTLLYNENLRVFAPEEPPKLTRLDWRDHGMVTSTKNQGACGSCWAFAAIACLESHILIEGSQTSYDLSEQYVVSCDNTNSGCNGCIILTWCLHSVDLVTTKDRV